jgi:nitroimidazol reductase NimA-like FMN-containing flavoprotein (pyridoxamine 5'-phosphate oxidase superfamily)
MRRKDREVAAVEEIRGILESCKTCHLAMVDNGAPYVVPLSFGYEIAGGTLKLFFHSAKEGRKIDILRRNSAVFFAVCVEGEPVFAEKTPCIR